ncbi:Uncharacterised protein [[Flavobacterium] thermophilum]|nr:Uncharacterised protein [[Flavobacterium] thermophilum]
MYFCIKQQLNGLTKEEYLTLRGTVPYCQEHVQRRIVQCQTILF